MPLHLVELIRWAASRKGRLVAAGPTFFILINSRHKEKEEKKEKLKEKEKLTLKEKPKLKLKEKEMEKEKDLLISLAL